VDRPTSTPAESLLSIPNQLSASRFFLAVVLFVLIALESWLYCLLVFVIATVTDWLDGYLARGQGLTSALGRSLDPLADKVLTCGAFIFLLPRGMAPGEGWLAPWMVTLVVARELIITGLRGYLEQQGVKFGADWLGKIKMGLQCAALIAIFVELWLRPAEPGESASAWFLQMARNGLIWAMVAATALSGVQYLWKAARLLRIHGPSR
jgi:CDP-diacylglycerol--glycerol-3-phosphate 3-phosphatidyltransferase